MIQANELRIGNLVKTYEYPEGNSVTSITENYIDLKGSNIINIERIKPIPLTPQWLEKAGFYLVNHVHGYSFYSLNRKGKNANNPSLEIYDKKTLFYGISVKHSEYLHELQNLFYTLTGKELEFNQ